MDPAPDTSGFENTGSTGSATALAPSSVSDAALRAVIASQLHASLAMLRETIDRCPDDLWYDRRPSNAFWQIAYHTVYFAHLYLHERFEVFEPWSGHQRDAQHPDGIPGKVDPDSPLPVLPNPYSRAEVLAYWQVADDMVDAAIGAVDLTRAECGFSWYNVSKLEHQLVNIRHIQHHAAQLADRLRAAQQVGTRWVRDGYGAPAKT